MAEDQTPNRIQSSDLTASAWYQAVGSFFKPLGTSNVIAAPAGSTPYTIVFASGADLIVDRDLILRNVTIRFEGTDSRIVINSPSARLVLDGGTNIDYLTNSAQAACGSWEGIQLSNGELEVLNGSIQDAIIGVSVTNNGVLKLGASAVLLNNVTHVKVRNISQTASSGFNINANARFAATVANCNEFGVVVEEQRFPITVRGQFDAVNRDAVLASLVDNFTATAVKVNTNTSVTLRSTSFTLPNVRTEYGMRISTNARQNITANINVNNSDVRRAINGIGVERFGRSNVAVTINTMKDLTGNGVALFSTNRNGLAQISQNLVEDAKEGIVLEGGLRGSYVVTNNTVGNNTSPTSPVIGVGIRARELWGCTVEIENNTITNPLFHGIILTGDGFSGTVPTVYQVHGNTISNLRTGAQFPCGITAIHWIGQDVYRGFIGKIGKGNQINQCPYGIQIQGQFRSEVLHNTIQNTPEVTPNEYVLNTFFGPHAGITMQHNGQFSTISYNSLTRSNWVNRTGRFSPAVGINLNSSQKKLLCSNSVNFYTVSSLNSAGNIRAKYINNTFQNYRYAFTLFNFGRVGWQYDLPAAGCSTSSCANTVTFDNRFEGRPPQSSETRLADLYTRSALGARTVWRTQAGYPLRPNPSTYEEDPRLGCPGCGAMPVQIPPAFSLSGSYANCTPSVAIDELLLETEGMPHPGYVWDRGQITEMVDDVRQPVPPVSEATAHAVDYRTRQAIYANLHRVAGLKAQHTALDSFYTALNGSVLAQIEALEGRIDTILRWTWHTESLDSTGTDTLYAVDTTALAARNSYIDATIALNAALTPTFAIETNHKNLNSLLLPFIKTQADTLGSSETESLQAIARQCPTLGGMAVLKARSWLLNLGHTELSDVDSCDYFQIEVPDSIDERRSLPAHLTGGSFQVYPNPAREQITVRYEPITAGETARLNIRTLDGRTLRTMVFSGAEVEVNVENLAAGLYLLELERPNRSREVVKLVIGQ